MKFKQFLEASDKVLKDIMAISSGTLANLTKIKNYKELEKIQSDFVEFYQNSKKNYSSWMDAWKDFYKDMKNEAKSDLNPKWKVGHTIGHYPRWTNANKPIKVGKIKSIRPDGFIEIDFIEKYPGEPKWSDPNKYVNMSLMEDTSITEAVNPKSAGVKAWLAGREVASKMTDGIKIDKVKPEVALVAFEKNKNSIVLKFSDGKRVEKKISLDELNKWFESNVENKVSMVAFKSQDNSSATIIASDDVVVIGK